MLHFMIELTAYEFNLHQLSIFYKKAAPSIELSESCNKKS